jgi:hypothetical protein
MACFQGVQAQDCPECTKMLEGGLYSIMSITNTGSYEKDIRTYLLSDQFRSAIRQGSWGASVTVPIEKLPVTLNMNHTEEDYFAFRNQLLKSSEIRIDSNWYQSFYSTIPNANLYEAYVACLKDCRDVGRIGFTQGKNIETEELVVFNFLYRPQRPSESMPVIQALTVEPQSALVNTNFVVGKPLESYNLMVICRRIPGKANFIAISADGSNLIAKSPAIETEVFSQDMPVGTIIASSLNFEQFNLATRNNSKSLDGVWTSQKSKWAPCDGRSVPGSRLALVSSTLAVVDLRGYFLRGLNSFDLGTPSSTVDPENRSVGSIQNDEFKSHGHTIVVKQNQSGGPDTFAAWWSGGPTGQSDQPIKAVGGGETRPKNVAVYYYIRIN